MESLKKVRNTHTLAYLASRIFEPANNAGGELAFTWSFVNKCTYKLLLNKTDISIVKQIIIIDIITIMD